MTTTTVYGPGGYDPAKPNNNIIEQYEVPDPPQAPLEPVAVAATLNAVLGVWSLEDAANALNLTPADLIHEAEAWAAAQEMNP
jgi:hypothetical protein